MSELSENELRAHIAAGNTQYAMDAYLQAPPKTKKTVSDHIRWGRNLDIFRDIILNREAGLFLLPPHVTAAFEDARYKSASSPAMKIILQSLCAAVAGSRDFETARDIALEQDMLGTVSTFVMRGDPEKPSCAGGVLIEISNAEGTKYYVQHGQPLAWHRIEELLGHGDREEEISFLRQLNSRFSNFMRDGRLMAFDAVMGAEWECIKGKMREYPELIELAGPAKSAGWRQDQGYRVLRPSK